MGSKDLLRYFVISFQISDNFLFKNQQKAVNPKIFALSFFYYYILSYFLADFCFNKPVI